MIRIYESPLGGGYEYNLTHSIAALTNGGTVTFPTLPKIPAVCQLTVECPAAGVHIAAALVMGSLTTSQLQYTLSGLATNSDYVLHVSLKW